MAHWAKLYHAGMAEFRMPFCRSYLANGPEIIQQIPNDRPENFAKPDRIAEGLRPLLSNAVFVTNGHIWARQRRIIDPAFERRRLRDSFPAISAT